MPLLARIVTGLLFGTPYWFIQMGGIGHYEAPSETRIEAVAALKPMIARPRALSRVVRPR
jgi:hypothetical protein